MPGGYPFQIKASDKAGVNSNKNDHNKLSPSNNERNRSDSRPKALSPRIASLHSNSRSSSIAPTDSSNESLTPLVTALEPEPTRRDSSSSASRGNSLSRPRPSVSSNTARQYDPQKPSKLSIIYNSASPTDPPLNGNYSQEDLDPLQKPGTKLPLSPQTGTGNTPIGRNSFNRSSVSSGYVPSRSGSEDLGSNLNSSTGNRYDRAISRLLSKKEPLISKLSSRYRSFGKSRSRDDNLQPSESPLTDNIPLEQFASPESGPATTVTSPNNLVNSNSRRDSILTFMYSNSLAPVTTASSYRTNTDNAIIGGVGGTSDNSGTGVGWPGYGGVTKRPTKQKSPFHRPSRETLQTWLYSSSLMFLFLCFAAVVVATPIDMIIQSQRTGQFWNAIIIMASYAFVAIIAGVLLIARIIVTRRSLAAIPHQYIPGLADIPIELFRNITSELERCRKIARDSRPVFQNPPLHISHPGLMPPEITDLGRLADTPYIDVIRLASEMIAMKAEILHPSLARGPGMSLRDYIYTLHNINIIDMPISHVNDFINQYERARFSGKLVSESQFGEFMESCRRLMMSTNYSNIRANGSLKGAPQSFYAPTTDGVSRAGSVRVPNAFHPVNTANTSLNDYGSSPNAPNYTVNSDSLKNPAFSNDSDSLNKIPTNLSLPNENFASRVSTQSNNHSYNDDQGNSSNDSPGSDEAANGKKDKGKSKRKQKENPTPPSFRDPWSLVPTVSIGGHLPSPQPIAPAGRSSSISSTGTTKWNPEYESSRDAFVNSVTEMLRESTRPTASTNTVPAPASAIPIPASTIPVPISTIPASTSTLPNNQLTVPSISVSPNTSRRPSIHLQPGQPKVRRNSQIWQQQQQIQQLQQLQQQLYTLSRVPSRNNTAIDVSDSNIHSALPASTTHQPNDTYLSRKNSSSSIVIHQVETPRRHSNTESLSRIAAQTINPGGLTNTATATAPVDPVTIPLSSVVSNSSVLGTGSLPKLTLVPTRLDSQQPASNKSAAVLAAAAVAEYNTVFKTAQDMAPRGSVFQARPLSSASVSGAADYGSATPGGLLMATLKSKYEAAAKAAAATASFRNNKAGGGGVSAEGQASFVMPISDTSPALLPVSGTPDQTAGVATSASSASSVPYISATAPSEGTSNLSSGVLAPPVVFRTDFGTPLPSSALARMSTESLGPDAVALPAASTITTVSTLASSTNASTTGLGEPFGATSGTTPAMLLSQQQRRYPPNTTYTNAVSPIQEAPSPISNTGSGVGSPTGGGGGLGDIRRVVSGGWVPNRGNVNRSGSMPISPQGYRDTSPSQSLRKRMASQIRSWSRGSSRSPDREENFSSPGMFTGAAAANAPQPPPTSSAAALAIALANAQSPGPGFVPPQTPTSSKPLVPSMLKSSVYADGRGRVPSMGKTPGSPVDSEGGSEPLPEPWYGYDGSAGSTPISGSAPGSASVSRVPSYTGSVIVHKLSDQNPTLKR